MPRPATGQILARKTASGLTSYSGRFRAYGKRRHVHFGYSPTWSKTRAREELETILADVRRGIWVPPDERQAVEADSCPTLHQFASDWVADREREGLAPRTIEHLRWTLSYHLLPKFADFALDQITIEQIDRYSRSKVAEKRLSNGSINKTIDVLGAILERAVEYGYIARNPARGRNRKLKTARPVRLYLEPGQTASLLAAAAELDREDPRGRKHRRALLATLAYAGLRISELLALRWQDVDLARRIIRVRASKTAAGIRTVDICPELIDDLVAWKGSTAHHTPSDLVFPTRNGTPDNRNNVRRRVMLRAVERANDRLATANSEVERLPDGLSPHALRRTFASWLIAGGADVAYAMDQLGHTDPKMTLGIYAKAIRSRRRRPQPVGEPQMPQAGSDDGIAEATLQPPAKQQ